MADPGAARMRRTVVVSRDPSAAGDGGARTRLAALANESVVRNCRWFWIMEIVPPCN
jgi:hypothetical protein